MSKHACNLGFRTSTLLLLGVGSFACTRAAPANQARSALEVQEISRTDSVFDGLSRTSVRMETLLGSRGAVLLVLDDKACESCLNIDTELRALRQSWPQLAVHVIAHPKSAVAVREYFKTMRIHKVVWVPYTSIFSGAEVGTGSLTAHLVSGDGRVLFTQVRYPGSRRQLVTEDLDALRAMVTPIATP